MNHDHGNYGRAKPAPVDHRGKDLFDHRHDWEGRGDRHHRLRREFCRRLGQLLDRDGPDRSSQWPRRTALTARRPEITMEIVDKFLTKMYRTNPDFVFTVTRGFVRNCQTPILILPDDIPAHPYAVAMEAAMLAPKAEVSLFPWKEPKERIPLAVRQIRSFLRAHRSAAA